MKTRHRCNRYGFPHSFSFINKITKTFMQQNTKIANEFFSNLTPIVADTASLGLCHPMALHLGLGVLPCQQTGLPRPAYRSSNFHQKLETCLYPVGIDPALYFLATSVCIFSLHTNKLEENGSLSHSQNVQHHVFIYTTKGAACVCKI